MGKGLTMRRGLLPVLVEIPLLATITSSSRNHDYILAMTLFLMFTFLFRGRRLLDYSGPEVVRIENTSLPDPQSGKLLVLVHAAGVNPGEWMIRIC
jgi:hypothetical protein